MMPLSGALAASPYEVISERGRVNRGEFLNESFDDLGVFPPAGWTYTPGQAFPYIWHYTTEAVEVHTGAAAVDIDRRDDVLISEIILSPALDLSSANGSGLRLSFWYRTDPFWFIPDSSFVRLQVTNNGIDFPILWSTETTYETGWAWRNVVLDLSSWAGQVGDFHVRFRYTGRAAANFQFDDVRVGYLAPPVPPANDTCQGAVGAGFVVGPTPGSFLLQGNSFFALHDYSLALGTSCTGHAHNGRDLVWRIDVPEDHRLVATMTTAGSWDDTLFLVTDCADPEGTCVDGDRGFPDGAFVAVPNFGPGIKSYYLIVSGWNEGAGEFTIHGGILPGTPVRPTTWGRLKASYR